MATVKTEEHSVPSVSPGHAECFISSCRFEKPEQANNTNEVLRISQEEIDSLLDYYHDHPDEEIDLEPDPNNPYSIIETLKYILSGSRMTSKIWQKELRKEKRAERAKRKK